MQSSLTILGIFSLMTASAFAAGSELVGERAPASSICPSPEEAQKKMSVPDGYEVRCFAHEPMVQNPVAMTWDHRGRLWVVEAYEYPEGSPHPAPFGGEAKDDQYHPMPQTKGHIPRDRVIILEDTDNDGTADKRTVFVEGLNLASAIICGDNGIYVGQQPHILHFRDDNGDDKPDAWRVVLTGFGREDTHELVNSFTWGPDGWLYMTHGVFTNSKVRRPGQPEKEGMKFDAGIGRARPQRSAAVPAVNSLPKYPPDSSTASNSANLNSPAWEFEVFADGTSNPWGCDYDAAGNFFVSACVIDHFFHMAPGGIYVRQGGAPENPYSYELLPSIVKHKHFRAAYAGIQIYQGGRYPKDTWGHAFIGNIHDNAIHEEVITPVGATFKCEPRRDFLRANDGWFRPVSTQTGPDGFLWVMDWCDKYPCYQNAKANPEGVDRDRGRIWRVVVKDDPKAEMSREVASLNLKEQSVVELFKNLEHPNNWVRRMARRLIAEGDSKSDFAALLELIDSHPDLSVKMEALWAATARGFSLDRDTVKKWLAEDSPEQTRVWICRMVGEAAIRETLSGSPNKQTVSDWMSFAYLNRVFEDANPAVRRACAIALRQWSTHRLTTGSSADPKLAEICGQMAMQLPREGEMDPTLFFSLWMAIEPGLVTSPRAILLGQGFLEEEFENQSNVPQPFASILAQKAMRRLCDTRNQAKLDIAIEFCTKIGSRMDLLASALEGLVRGQEGGVIKPTKDVSAILNQWRAVSDPNVRKQAQTLAVVWGDDSAVKEELAALQDSAKPEKDRITILQSLRKVRTDTVKQGLKPLLDPKTPVALSIAAMRAASDLGSDDYIAPLLTLAASKNANVRNAALEALASREAWTKAMLDAIANEKISATGFPAPVRRSLATSQNKAIQDQAFKVLGAWQDSSADVKNLIALKRQAALTGEPNMENGKLIFQGTCMICHEFHGGGQKVGPDLIGSGRSNLDAILANIIDPNQIIGNGYENFVVVTKDGRNLAGRVVEDTPGHVKLLGPGGAAQVVPRDQIANLTNTKQSLMPMGFGALPDEAFRDLVWYILAPPEEGPLTKEKKDILVKGVEVQDGPAKPKGTNWRAIDWESVSLWNPAWKVSAPDFERTPVVLSEYHGRKNVLLMHPFAKDKPASLEQKIKLETGKQQKLTATVAAHDQGDWELRIKADGQVLKTQTIGHDGQRWHKVEVDLAPFAGKEVTLLLEVVPTGWSWEFAYWGAIEIK